MVRDLGECLELRKNDFLPFQDITDSPSSCQASNSHVNGSSPDTSRHEEEKKKVTELVGNFEHTERTGFGPGQLMNNAAMAASRQSRVEDTGTTKHSTRPDVSGRSEKISGLREKVRCVALMKLIHGPKELLECFTCRVF